LVGAGCSWVGVLWFALASMLCGLALNVEMLIASRALQGVGGALLTPGSLAILQSSFRPADRARAIGAWSGLAGIAGAAGPFLGGWLIGVASWRWIFLINVPVAFAVLLIANRHVPESRDPAASHHTDMAGAGLVVVGLAASDLWADRLAQGGVQRAVGLGTTDRRRHRPQRASWHGRQPPRNRCCLWAFSPPACSAPPTR